MAALLAGVGSRIREARRSRHISLSRMCEDIGCSELTMIRIERGAPTVAVGTYALVLQRLGLEKDLELLARERKDKGEGETA